MQAVHVLATAYGWTKADVERLTYQDINYFLGKIHDDRRQEAKYFAGLNRVRRR